MRKLLLLSIVFIAFNANAQEFAKVDVSSLDAVYFPNRSAHDITFAKTIEEKENLMTKVRILYSRPLAKGREVFGGLVKFNEKWRLGANETTEIEFYSPAKFGNTLVKPGVYALYCVPGEDSWTLKLHPNHGGWGVYDFEAADDLASVVGEVKKSDEFIEALSMIMVSEDGKNVTLKIGWENTVAEFPITVF